MSDEKFKLPGSSYDELAKFIKAYGHVNKPTELSEICKLTGTKAPNISQNVGFFMATGILEGGKAKAPTALGHQLGLALDHNKIEDIRGAWRQIVHENEFLSKLLTAIRIRNGMDASTFEAHIAYSAGQPKRPRVMTGARTVIDILKAAELIVENGGKYVLTQSTEGGIEDEELVQERAIQQTPLTEIRPTPVVPSIVGSPEQPHIRIHININCTPSDIPTLGAQIRTLVEEITGSETNNSGDE